MSEQQASLKEALRIANQKHEHLRNLLDEAERRATRAEDERDRLREIVIGFAIDRLPRGGEPERDEDEVPMHRPVYQRGAPSKRVCIRCFKGWPCPDSGVALTQGPDTE